LEGDTNIQEGTLFQDSPVVSDLKTRIFFSAEHLAGLCLQGSNAVWSDVLKGCDCSTLCIKKTFVQEIGIFALHSNKSALSVSVVSGSYPSCLYTKFVLNVQCGSLPASPITKIT
jgi:hypothetical protein